MFSWCLHCQEPPVMQLCSYFGILLYPFFFPSLLEAFGEKKFINCIFSLSMLTLHVSSYMCYLSYFQITVKGKKYIRSLLKKEYVQINFTNI